MLLFKVFLKYIFKIFFWLGYFFKVSMEFIMILLLLSVWIFWSWVMWDLSSATRGWICTLCIGRWRLKHWTTREVPKFIFNWRIITLQCCIGFYCTAMWISWTSFSIYFNLILLYFLSVFVLFLFFFTYF